MGKGIVAMAFRHGVPKSQQILYLGCAVKGRVVFASQISILEPLTGEVS